MTLPKEIQEVIAQLEKAGFEAFVVGGCVRDLLLGRIPKDWDVTTNAKPEEIQKVFPKSFYANKFGTVTVLTSSKTLSNSPLSQPSLKAMAGEAQLRLKATLGEAGGEINEVEVTTYRIDAAYSDRRHPDQVIYTANLEEDLARRDFTVNAMALSLTSDRVNPELKKYEVNIDGMLVIDPFGGLKDLDAKLIRAVRDPAERFDEDALRLLRAIRLAAQLGFAIEEKTQAMITEKALNIKAVSAERIRDELVKLLMSDNPERGFEQLRTTGLLLIILPELAEGIGVEQNKHHIFTVYEHSIKSAQFAAQYKYSLPIRLAALLHDIGKPRTQRLKGNEYTFYGHDIVGARMAEKLLKRLRFSKEEAQKVTHLIRHHMFYYDVGKVTETGARRLLRRVGKGNFADLVKLRIAERKGSGVPKAEPYRLRHLQFLVEKAAKEPISVNQLAVRGNDIMEKLDLRPGPQIGGILNALLAEVLDDPSRNQPEYLLKRAGEIKDKNPEELKKLGEAAKDKEEVRREEAIKRKYHV